MSLKGISTEDFIEEVRKYPCIWNLQCEDYRRLAMKSKAWDLIARAFIENYDDLGDYDRATINKKLGNRWRNLRDSYVRAQKKKPSDGSSKDYLFAKNLAFLAIDYDKRKQRHISDSEDSNEETPEPIMKKIKSERDNPLRDLKIGQSLSDAFSLEYVGTPCSVEPLVQQVQQTLSEEFDDDRLFFESLLPATRHFDMDQKLQFRSEVLSLISKIRKSGSANPLDQQ